MVQEKILLDLKPAVSKGGCGRLLDQNTDTKIDTRKKFYWEGYVLCEHDNRAWKEVTFWQDFEVKVHEKKLCTLANNHDGSCHGQWFSDNVTETHKKDWEEVFQECRHE